MSEPFGSPPPPPPAPPSGAYGVPIGGYPAPAGGYMVPYVEPPASRATGAIALVLSLIAAVVVPIVGAVFGYQIGVLVPVTAIDVSVESTFQDDLALLAPARMQVLWAEVTFWVGTAIGITALVIGIIATAKRRGRGLGITAIILAAVGPAFFFLAVFATFGVGAAVGSL
ncbi:hypothetical protein [Microbacterium sp. H1-D42]|uniref:hypothetical protein n=1 Tax=Microbacterium sp. H1-D42 TaxID=2925844 RepID=UPI001F52EE5B|nr:hypothetical protein [Microbacterium sp. H1-D42]UNK71921.1 hypothetical protein MNR00_05585 [Microbacterium sp. H1-D42]